MRQPSSFLYFVFCAVVRLPDALRVQFVRILWRSSVRLAFQSTPARTRDQDSVALHGNYLIDRVAFLSNSVQLADHECGEGVRDGSEVLASLVETNSRVLPATMPVPSLDRGGEADSARHSVVSDPGLQRLTFEFIAGRLRFNQARDGTFWEDTADVAIAVCKRRTIPDLRPS